MTKSQVQEIKFSEKKHFFHMGRPINRFDRSSYDLRGWYRVCLIGKRWLISLGCGREMVVIQYL